jgi:hypothetical protein
MMEDFQISVNGIRYQNHVTLSQNMINQINFNKIGEKVRLFASHMPQYLHIFPGRCTPSHFKL